MTTTLARHPLAEFVDRLHARLDELLDVGAWSMSPPEVRETLPSITRAVSRLAELELRVLAQGDRVDATAAKGADLAAWWAVETAQPGPPRDGPPSSPRRSTRGTSRCRTRWPKDEPFPIRHG